MINQNQVLLLQRKLNLLTDSRRKVDSLFSQLEKETNAEFIKDIDNYVQLLRMGDAAAFIAGAAKSMFSIAKTAFTNLSKVGSELIKQNKELVLDLGLGAVSKTQGTLSLATSPEEPWLDYLTNFMSPSYWIRFSGRGPNQMNMIKQQVLSDVKNQRILSLSVMDRKINATKKLLREAQMGHDLNNVA